MRYLLGLCRNALEKCSRNTKDDYFVRKEILYERI